MPALAATPARWHCAGCGKKVRWGVVRCMPCHKSSRLCRVCTCPSCGGPMSGPCHGSCALCLVEQNPPKKRLPPPIPTCCEPGSPGKIAMLTWRQVKGFTLYHKDDVGAEPEPVGYGTIRQQVKRLHLEDFQE